MELQLADPHAWAAAEFGHARLNDRRNVARAVQMAAAVAARPHATLACVFADAAAQQAAYDFVENPRIDPAALVRASATATARRAAAEPLVLLAGDGVDLTLRDPHDARALGPVGSYTTGARGLLALDALALREDGVPLGLAGLLTWVRPPAPPARPHARRPPADRESAYWLDLRAQVRAVFAAHAPATTRVFLHDSGADAWLVLLDLVVHDAAAGEYDVIRAAHNRRACTDPTAPSYLWDLLGRRAAVQGRFRQRIPPGHGRAARRAQFEVRADRVTLDVQWQPSQAREPVTLWAVRVRERGRVPAGSERLEWVLLTTWPVRSLRAARRVIGWYVQRWRVEDHHKTWKKSGSDVEATALRDRHAIEVWVTFHAAVAARALRLTHLARAPDTATAPATTVFTDVELAALRRLRARWGRATPDDLTVEQAVTLVAGLGGYVPARGRRPGPKVLRRGLADLELVAQVLTAVIPRAGPGKPRRK